MGVHVVSISSSSVVTAKYHREGTAAARGIERGSIAPHLPSAKKHPSVKTHGGGTVSVFFLGNLKKSTCEERCASEDVRCAYSKKHSTRRRLPPKILRSQEAPGSLAFPPHKKEANIGGPLA